MVHRACGPRSLSRKAPTSIGPCITYTRMEGLTHFQVMDGARGVLAGIDRHLRQISLRLTTRLYRRERRVSGVAKNTTPPYTSLYLCSSHTLTHILPHSLSHTHTTPCTAYFSTPLQRSPQAARAHGRSANWRNRETACAGLASGASWPAPRKVANKNVVPAGVAYVRTFPAVMFVSSSCHGTQSVWIVSVVELIHPNCPFTGTLASLSPL